MSNQYENFEAVKDAFAAGEFDLPEVMEVDRIRYHVSKSNDSNKRIDEMYRNNLKTMLVYSLAKENRQLALQHGLKDWIVFIWGWDGLDLVRYDVRTTTQSRGAPQMTGTADIKEGQNNIIGDVVQIGFTNFQNSNPLKAKVDTGATISSLHIDQMNVDKNSGQVTFISKQLSPNQITLPIAEQQSVKSSDGGTEYRPIVALNIKINGQAMDGVQFNLNDRSEMEFPVLIGQNILEKGGFLIDPRINEEGEFVEGEIDWDALQEEFKDVEQVITTQNQIIEMVRQSLSKRVLDALDLEGVIDLTPDK